MRLTDILSKNELRTLREADNALVPAGGRKITGGAIVPANKANDPRSGEFLGGSSTNPSGNQSNMQYQVPNTQNPNGINPANWFKPQNPNAVKINQTPSPGQTTQAGPTGATTTPNTPTGITGPAGTTPPPPGQTTQPATTTAANSAAGLNMPKSGIMSKAVGKIATGLGKAVGGVQGAAQEAPRRQLPDGAQRLDGRLQRRHHLPGADPLRLRSEQQLQLQPPGRGTDQSGLQ